nr:FtsW/RodA/SpoVE family cell cycle protein [Limosilactobacillus difficilis]
MHYWDWMIAGPYIILCCLGIVMVYSASAGIQMQNGLSPRSYLVRQLIYVLMGLVVFTLFSSLKLEKLRSPVFLRWFFIILAGLLLIVRIHGAAINGAHGWLHLGFFNIQPAEVCKFFLILYLSDRFAGISEKGLSYKDTKAWQPTILLGALLFLIIIQPDIGGFTINTAIAVVILLASGMSLAISLTVLGLGVCTLAFGVPAMAHIFVGHIHNYQAARFVAFIDPFQHARGIGSQLVNSYYAISNGGFHGVGLGNSIQKMGYLPEPNTDFIMSIIAEELGLIGVTVILLLLAIIIMHAIRLGVKTHSMYEALICYGVGTFISVETLFNVGGVLGLLPITGVTFPFVSYGGSSMLVLCASIGLVENISIRRKRQRAQQKLSY